LLAVALLRLLFFACCCFVAVTLFCLLLLGCFVAVALLLLLLLCCCCCCFVAVAWLLLLCFRYSLTVSYSYFLKISLMVLHKCCNFRESSLLAFQVWIDFLKVINLSLMQNPNRSYNACAAPVMGVHCIHAYPSPLFFISANVSASSTFPIPFP